MSRATSYRPQLCPHCLVLWRFFHKLIARDAFNAKFILDLIKLKFPDRYISDTERKEVEDEMRKDFRSKRNLPEKLVGQMDALLVRFCCPFLKM